MKKETFNIGTIQVNGGPFPHTANPYHKSYDPAALDAYIEKCTLKTLRKFEQAGQAGLDLVLGGEDMQHVCGLLSLPENKSFLKKYTHAIPGPLTDRIAAIARQYHMFIGACFFEKAGGQLGASGCVAYLFDNLGRLVVSAEQADEDTLMEIAIDAGADDVVRDDGVFEITCDVAAYAAVKDALDAREIVPSEAELGMMPDSTMVVPADKAKQIIGLAEAIEDHDDVQKVYSNFEIPEDVLAELEGEG